jgi:hypothetical protein
VLGSASIRLSNNLQPILLYRLLSVIYLPLCKPIVLQQWRDYVTCPDDTTIGEY